MPLTWPRLIGRQIIANLESPAVVRFRAQSARARDGAEGREGLGLAGAVDARPPLERLQHLPRLVGLAEPTPEGRIEEDHVDRLAADAGGKLLEIDHHRIGRRHAAAQIVECKRGNRDGGLCHVARSESKLFAPSALGSTRTNSADSSLENYSAAEWMPLSELPLSGRAARLGDRRILNPNALGTKLQVANTVAYEFSPHELRSHNRRSH